VKSKHIIGAIVGAAIGMILGYFGTGSLSAINLLIGAIAGALVGLYLVTAHSTPASGRSGGG
jgi:outer membrane lipoprotein SlyB